MKTSQHSSLLVPQTGPVHFLIRHGESESNAGLPTLSPASIRLTENGRRQAIALAQTLEREPGLIVVSPYLRTHETAAPLIAKYPKVPVEEWPIQEFTYLDTRRLAGTTEAERSAEVAGYWSRCDAFAGCGEGAESFAQFIERVDAMILRLRGLSVGGIVTVFTHGYVMHATGLRLQEPASPVNDALMQKFRAAWLCDAPAHCEIRPLGSVPRSAVTEPIEPALNLLALPKAKLKAWAEAQPSPELPDDPESYFDMERPGVRLLDIVNLIPRRDPAEDPASVHRAMVFAAAARAGRLPKRGPLTVSDRGDGTFTILDGTSTYGAAVQAKWSVLPVVVSVEESDSSN
jgi:broad specificity phosphatase PhoE